MEVHQVCAGVVGDFRLGLARQAEADIVLAFKDPLNVPIAFRLVVSQPGQKRYRLAGHDMLRRQGKNLLLRSVGSPALRIGIGPVVGGDDAVAGGPAVFAPEIQAFAVAGDSDSRHIRRADSGLLQHARDHRAVGFPHLVHVALHKARLRRDGSRRGDCFSDFFSAAVKDGCFCRRPAVIQSDKKFHMLLRSVQRPISTPESSQQRVRNSRAMRSLCQRLSPL